MVGNVFGEARFQYIAKGVTTIFAAFNPTAHVEQMLNDNLCIAHICF